MRFALTMAAVVLLFAGCGADEQAGSNAAHDTGTSADAPVNAGDAPVNAGDAPVNAGDAEDCVGDECSEAVCAQDADCAPVYDEGCNCIWVCFPAGETPPSCPGLEACPEGEPNTTLACACDGGQCVASSATP